MILCDANVLLCLVDPSQSKHNDYKKEVTRIASPLITTWACLTEAMYLAYRQGGLPMQKQLGKLLLSKKLIIHEIQERDYSRLLELMEQYRNLPMDIADATLVVAAEKTGYRKILTLDSDFYVYLINARENFEVIQL